VPVSAVAENDQFEGVVSWSSSPDAFAANTVYTATIILTAKSGYTLDGVAKNFFKVARADVTNNANSGVITARFEATGSDPPAVVNIKEISGVIAPVKNAVPETEIIESTQYTGIITWSGSPAKFEGNTVYTATITLTAKSGYTFKGINADFFTVSGATSVYNSESSGVIKAEFPATEGLTLVIEKTTIKFPSGAEFNIVSIPEIPSSYSFPIGVSDEYSRNIPERFMLAETEVTFELWKEVYDWAISNGYSFSNSGNNGWDSNLFEDHEIDRAISVQYPVININWRDSIVWCNALTEYFNMNNGSELDLECVYTYNGSVVRDSRESNATACDNVVQSMTAKGYRLLTCDEWEFAARYIGSTKPNHNYFVLKNGIYYTKGNGASGSSDYYGNTQILGEYAVNTLNSDHKTAIVKTKKPNALGIYDMSGNVYEWCFDKYNSASRTYRGGSWLAGGCILSIFCKMDGEYNETYEALGFRFCRKY